MLPAIVPCSRRWPPPPSRCLDLRAMGHDSLQQDAAFQHQQRGQRRDRHRQQPWGMDLPHQRAIRSACSRSRSTWLTPCWLCLSPAVLSARRVAGRSGRVLLGKRASDAHQHSSRSARRSPRSVRNARSSFRAQRFRQLGLDLPTGAVGGGPQPLDAAFRLVRAGIEANDERFKRGPVALQNAQGALQPEAPGTRSRRAARRRTISRVHSMVAIVPIKR